MDAETEWKSIDIPTDVNLRWCLRIFSFSQHREANYFKKWLRWLLYGFFCGNLFEIMVSTLSFVLRRERIMLPMFLVIVWNRMHSIFVRFSFIILCLVILVFVLTDKFELKKNWLSYQPWIVLTSWPKPKQTQFFDYEYVRQNFINVV